MQWRTEQSHLQQVQHHGADLQYARRSLEVTDQQPGSVVTDKVAEFRRARVMEMQALVDSCVEHQFQADSRIDEMVARLRELYYFAPDMRSLVELVKDNALKESIHVWAQYNMDMNNNAWSRLADALERLLQEPPLYQRNWSQGPIEPQFTAAISGWIDLGECARTALANAARPEQIDQAKLFPGTVTVLHHGCMKYFGHLQTPGAEQLETIFATIWSHPDVNMDMFPAALTYFGSDGLQVLNRVATEVDDICSALKGYADQGFFDADDAAPDNPVSAPPQQPTPAGWYPDPAGGPGLRWWDGQQWTGHLR